MANSLISLSYFLICSRVGIFVCVQFLWIVFSNSFPEHPLALFSEVQRISEIYLSVLVFVVTS
jgi:hypothetical protein